MGADLTAYAAALLGSIGRALFPDGLQGTARRNAWRAMVADAGRARARHEAEAALDRLTRPQGSAANG